MAFDVNVVPPSMTSFTSVSHVCFIKYRYPNAVIISDGYMLGLSTKDMTNQSRTKGMQGQYVHFTTGMIMQFTKERFLCNNDNKQRFSDALEH